MLCGAGQMFELFNANLLWAAPIIAFGTLEALQFVQGQSNFIIRLRLPHPIEPILGRGNCEICGVSKARCIFRFKHWANFNHIRQARGSMSYFISGGLLMPCKKLCVDQRARGIDHCHGLRQNMFEGAWFVRQTQEPIGRNTKAVRARLDCVSPLEAMACCSRLRKRLERARLSIFITFVYFN